MGDATRERRRFLGTAATGGLALLGCATAGQGAGAKKPEGEDEAEVTPGEDLMQEHGLLERILLIYEESAHRLEDRHEVDPAIVSRAATIVRGFVEDYHERQEEDFVFPRLQAAQRETALVGILRGQHERGRALTEAILASGERKTAELPSLLRAFIRMYRPHAAREETVLIPVFREVVGRGAYRELGEQFEDREHARFGRGGFEHQVAAVAELEQMLGLADLSRFTPAAP